MTHCSVCDADAGRSYAGGRRCTGCKKPICDECNAHLCAICYEAAYPTITLHALELRDLFKLRDDGYLEGTADREALVFREALHDAVTRDYARWRQMHPTADLFYYQCLCNQRAHMYKRHDGTVGAPGNSIDALAWLLAPPPKGHENLVHPVANLPLLPGEDPSAVMWVPRMNGVLPVTATETACGKCLYHPNAPGVEEEKMKEQLGSSLDDSEAQQRQRKALIEMAVDACEFTLTDGYADARKARRLEE